MILSAFEGGGCPLKAAGLGVYQPEDFVRPIIFQHTGQGTLTAVTPCL